MHQRDTSGLRKHARTKREEAIQRTEEGIRRLIKEGKSIGFKSVAEVADVSRAWLYQQPEIRARIEHLRQQQSPKVAVPSEQRASKSSNATIIRTLKERVKKIQKENQDLRQQLELSYGRLIRAEEEAERYKRQVDGLRRSCEELRQELMGSSASSATEAESLLEALGVPISTTLVRTIESAPVDTVRLAVEAFQDAAEEGVIRHPGGWIKRAIEEGWQPNSSYSKTTELDLFNQWFPLARAKGLVIASRQEGDEILVFTAEENWVPFHKILNKHSIDSLFSSRSEWDTVAKIQAKKHI